MAERNYVKTCTDHVDCGCEQGGTCCLECPLIACVYDVKPPHPKKKQAKAMFRDGMTKRAIAQELGLSRDYVAKLVA